MYMAHQNGKIFFFCTSRQKSIFKILTIFWHENFEEKMKQSVMIHSTCITSKTFLHIFSLCVNMARAPVAALTTNSSSSPQYKTISFRRSFSASNVFATLKQQAKPRWQTAEGYSACLSVPLNSKHIWIFFF